MRGFMATQSAYSDAWVKLLNAFGITDYRDALTGTPSGLRGYFDMANQRLYTQMTSNKGHYHIVPWSVRCEMFDKSVPPEKFNYITQQNIEASRKDGEPATSVAEQTPKTAPISAQTCMARFLSTNFLTYDKTIIGTNYEALIPVQLFMRVSGHVHQDEADINNLMKLKVIRPSGNVGLRCANGIGEELIHVVSEVFGNASPMNINGEISETSEDLVATNLSIELPSLRDVLSGGTTNIVPIKYTCVTDEDEASVGVKITGIISDTDFINKLQISPLAMEARTNDLSFQEVMATEDEHGNITMEQAKQRDLIDPTSILADLGLVAVVLQPANPDTGAEGVMAIIGSVSVNKWVLYHTFVHREIFGDLDAEHGYISADERKKAIEALEQRVGE